MSEENTPEEVTPAPEAEKTEQATVPVHVVEELRAKARKAEEALSALQAQEDERAKAELSELDRLKLELDEAKSTATKAQQAAALETKRSKARVALVENAAHSPEKVLRLLDLDTLDEAAIGDAVASLKESDAYLFRNEAAPAPGSVGAPTENGSNDADGQGPDQDLIWLQQSGLI